MKRDRMSVAKRFMELSMNGNPFFYVKDEYPIVVEWFKSPAVLENDDTVGDLMDELRDSHEMIYETEMLTWFRHHPQVFDEYVRDNCEFTDEPLVIWDVNDLFEHIRQARMWKAYEQAAENADVVIEALYLIALKALKVRYVDKKAYTEALSVLQQRPVDELTYGELLACGKNFEQF